MKVQRDLGGLELRSSLSSCNTTCLILSGPSAFFGFRFSRDLLYRYLGLWVLYFSGLLVQQVGKGIVFSIEKAVVIKVEPGA